MPWIILCKLSLGYRSEYFTLKELKIFSHIVSSEFRPEQFFTNVIIYLINWSIESTAEAIETAVPSVYQQQVCKQVFCGLYAINVLLLLTKEWSI